MCITQYSSRLKPIGHSYFISLYSRHGSLCNVIVYINYTIAIGSQNVPLFIHLFIITFAKKTGLDKITGLYKNKIYTLI